MKKANKMRWFALTAFAISANMLFGCAGYEVNRKYKDIPGQYIHKELPEADRALDAARQAGKEKECPAAFKAAEELKNKAFDAYRACNTQEAITLANEAKARTNSLCPPQAAKLAPLPPVPSGSLSANPATVAMGDSATLDWTCEDSTSAEIQPGIGKVPLQGSQKVVVSDSTSYTLTCFSAGGKATKTANLAIAAPVSTLSASPQSINQGQSATLNWTSKNATDCDIQPGIGSVEAEGSTTITPSSETVYTITCAGPGGTTSKSANVGVKPCSPTAVTIHFDFDKSDIKPSYNDELKKLGDLLKEFPNAKVVIEGHTDSTGPKKYNQGLSERRAKSVQDYIIKNFGIASERIKTKGYGLTKPVAGNKNKEGRAKNRRAESKFSCE